MSLPLLPDTLMLSPLPTPQQLGGDEYQRHTLFGPTTVLLYRVNIDRVLGDYGAANNALVEEGRSNVQAFTGPRWLFRCSGELFI